MMKLMMNDESFDEWWKSDFHHWSFYSRENFLFTNLKKSVNQNVSYKAVLSIRTYTVHQSRFFFYDLDLRPLLVSTIARRTRQQFCVDGIRTYYVWCKPRDVFRDFCCSSVNNKPECACERSVRCWVSDFSIINNCCNIKFFYSYFQIILSAQILF